MDTEADATTKQVAFLPWLRLETTYRIAGVEFAPWHRHTSDAMAPLLADAPLHTILSGYVDCTGKPVDSCVVATTAEHGWNLSDADFPAVEWAGSLLFLACWASNNYFGWMGPYVNASAFRAVWQRFSGSPVNITLTSKRRDGRNTVGGYKHGEVKFTAPLQYVFSQPATVDDTLLAALDRGNAEHCETTRRLRSALPFVSLANTDDELMTETAEAILMGSAFEQLLGGDGSAYKLGRKFDVLFRSCGRVTVEDAKQARSGIEIDKGAPERAAAQPTWWVHRKWMEELYDVRSKSVHEGTVDSRSWGWAPSEHLLMAAWVFPLAVKLLLERDGYYNCSDHDKIRCLAVDKLLAETNWWEKTDGGLGSHKWQDIVSSTAREYNVEQIKEQVLKQYAHLFPDETSSAE